MTRIVINFELPRTIPKVLLIEVVDNPLVNRWISTFVPTERLKAISCIRPFQPQVDLIYRSKIFKSLKENIDLFSEYGYTFKNKFPLINDVDRTFLNQAHRFFTSHAKLLGEQVSLAQQNQQFELADSIRQSMIPLFKINDDVHRLEREFIHNNELQSPIVNDIDIRSVHGPGHGYNHPNFLEFTDLPNRKQYHTFDHYDVILSPEILGKSSLVSFYDNDNPLNKDTTGHHGSFGGVIIQTTDSRERIYRSDNFKKWLAENNCDYSDLWGDVPIGNIVNKNLDFLEELHNDISTGIPFNVSYRMHRNPNKIFT